MWRKSFIAPKPKPKPKLFHSERATLAARISNFPIRNKYTTGNLLSPSIWVSNMPENNNNVFRINNKQVQNVDIWDVFLYTTKTVFSCKNYVSQFEICRHTRCLYIQYWLYASLSELKFASKSTNQWLALAYRGKNVIATVSDLGPSMPNGQTENENFDLQLDFDSFAYHAIWKSIAVRGDSLE
jgi:hypothetical protein